MTAQLSRERLEEKLLEHIKHGGDSEEETMIRMLLAGMDSEPVAWTDEQELRDLEKSGCAYLFTVKPITPNADPRRVIRLYTTPPAPMAVPDVATPETVQALSGVQACFAGGWAYLDESQREIASDVWNACRASMLQGAENAEPLTTIQPAPELDSSPKNDESHSGSSPVVPDGWKLVPVEPTAEMCKAGYEAQDKWPSEQCDNFKERHYSFSQPRYKAMLAAAPAAPEQEV